MPVPADRSDDFSAERSDDLKFPPGLGDLPWYALFSSRSGLEEYEGLSSARILFAGL